MWLDNASEVDILFYEPYANVIADISKNPSYKPLTIGVFGVWGAGKSTLLKLIEQKMLESIESGDSENEKYKAWNVPTIINWVKSEPKDLEKIRLDRYFYLTRESLKKADIDVSTLSSAAKDVLEQLGGATRGLIDQIMKNMAALNAVDQSGVFGVVIPKISKGEIPFYIIRSLFVSFESFRDKICNSLESYPKKIVVGNIPAIKEMRSKDQQKIDNLLTIWEKSGIIDKESIKTIKEKGK